MTRAAEQSLAADGATAGFSSNFVPFSLNTDHAPQLKASVRFLLSNQRGYARAPDDWWYVGSCNDQQ